MSGRRLRTAGLAAALLTLLPAAACGSEDPAVCSSVDELGASVEQLGVIQLGENGRAQLESQMAAVSADLAQVRTDAEQQYGAQVAAVTAAAGVVRAQLQAARADPTAATLRPLAAAVADLGSDAAALRDAVAGTC
jgi:hypothetical protein